MVNTLTQKTEFPFCFSLLIYWKTIKIKDADFCFNQIFFPLSKVFDNYAVTVMIGGEPYTLGLFDTAGNMNVLRISLHHLYLCQSKKNRKNFLISLVTVVFRSGGLWQAASSQLSTNRCVPRMFLCSLTFIIWKCQREGQFLNNVLLIEEKHNLDLCC